MLFLIEMLTNTDVKMSVFFGAKIFERKKTLNVCVVKMIVLFFFFALLYQYSFPNLTLLDCFVDFQKKNCGRSQITSRFRGRKL